ncbi:MAG: hypothetical protein ACOX6P_08220 [Candidatus Merdivicinus sp.]|jgi:hypothetical protein
MKREVAAGREVKILSSGQVPEQVIFAEYVRFQTGRQKMNTMEVPQTLFCVFAEQRANSKANCASLGCKCPYACRNATNSGGDWLSVQIPGKTMRFFGFLFV